MTPTQGFLLSDRKNEDAVHAKRGDGGPPGRRQSGNAHPFPAEMVFPPLAARVEQRDSAAAGGIDGGTARLLAQRAGHASQGQIRGLRRAPGALRHDVVDVKGGFLALL
jgi:hypothetical protein